MDKLYLFLKFSIPLNSPSFTKFGKLKKLNVHKNIKLFGFDFSGQVEMVENNWNAIESFIFDWGDVLQGRKMARKS